MLVVEDDPSAVRLLRTYLEDEGYGVRVAADGPSGLAEARAYPPAAILLDILLPGMESGEVLRELKADPALRDVPVIVVTVVDERGLGLALGATDYFLKPVDRAVLLARLARYSFTTKVRERTVRILAVDDDPAALELVESALRSEGFEVTRATGGRAALERAGEERSTSSSAICSCPTSTASRSLAEGRAMLAREPVDLILLDMHLPDGLGLSLAAELRTQPPEARPAVLALTASVLPAEQQAAIDAGCDAFLAKPYAPAALVDAIGELVARRGADPAGGAGSL